MQTLYSQALFEAAKEGHTQCVKILLDKGASVDHTNESGDNCLTQAIKNNYR